MESTKMLISMSPTLKAAAEKAARDDARSLPSFLEKLLSDHLTATRGGHFRLRPLDLITSTQEAALHQGQDLRLRCAPTLEPRRREIVGLQHFGGTLTAEAPPQ